MRLYQSFDFSEGIIGVTLIAFSGRVFLTEFWGTFFCELFFRCLFFLGQQESTPRKNTQKLSQ